MYQISKQNASLFFGKEQNFLFLKKDCPANRTVHSSRSHQFDDRHFRCVAAADADAGHSGVAAITVSILRSGFLEQLVCNIFLGDIGERSAVCSKVALLSKRDHLLNDRLNFLRTIEGRFELSVLQKIGGQLAKHRLCLLYTPILSRLSFDGAKTAAGSFDLTGATTYEAAWAGVGQYTDQINPCQYMTYMGAIANGGQAAVPYLVQNVYFGDSRKYSASTSKCDRALDEDTADRLAEMMHYTVQNVYGDWYFSGLYAGAKSGTAEDGNGEPARSKCVLSPGKSFGLDIERGADSLGLIHVETIVARLCLLYTSRRRRR